MTPSLQQAIKLLQLSRIELEETLAQEILENPVLDVEEPNDETTPAEGESPAETDRATNEEAVSGEKPTETKAEEDPLPSEEETYADIDVEAFFADYLGDGRSEGPSMAARAADQDYIGNIDEDGFLRASREEIVDGTGCDEPRLDEAMAVVRSLDPPGISASSLQECLATQIKYLMDVGENGNGDLLETAHLVITDHWEELLHQRWDALAESLGYSEVGEIKQVLDVIQGLELKGTGL